MQRLGKGLCLCCVALLTVSCSQDKKLPTGERLPVLDNSPQEEVLFEQAKTVKLPAAIINNAWQQTGVNPQHIIGNLKAGFNLTELWSENFGEGISKRDIILAAPVVSDNRVFVMDSKGKVSAFNLKSGEFLWKN